MKNIASRRIGLRNEQKPDVGQAGHFIVLQFCNEV